MHIDCNYDVTVVGAGTAGVIAALQAARAGVKTLLIEKTGQPGGTATSGGVDFPGLFHAWGRQVIAGIGWELVTRTVAEAGGVLPDFSKWETCRHWQLQIPVNSPLYTCIMDEALREAHVDVRYHTMVATVKEDADKVRLTLCGREGLSAVNTVVLIDASGDANTVELAGYPLRRNNEVQPCTPMLRVGGYDPATLDEEAIEARFHKAMAAGRLTRLDTGMSGSIITFLRNHGSNCIHVRAEDPASSSGRSRVEQDARAAVLRLYRFLRSCPGLSGLQLEYLAPECGVREGATIEGELTISTDDYRSGKVWDDSLSYAFYPLDLHLNTHEGLHCVPLETGVVPTVPLRAMIPRGSQRLLVAGRCVSSDQLANSALRVQASCMAMGQSAGAVAALAARKFTSPIAVPLGEVRALLQAHGAIIP